MTTRRFGRYRVELSREDKVLFPDSGITKGELIAYYDDIAAVMVPHIRGRPLTLHRFPDGIGKEGFYQQQRSEHFPDWIPSRLVPRAEQGERREGVDHVLGNNRATLVYLANQAVITLHGWNARVPRLRRPDRLVFDLDPPGRDFEAVREAARHVVALMKEIGLAPHVMTTGSSGLHVVAPLRARAGFDEVRGLARRMASVLADAHDDALTTEQRKDKRRGRVYLDVMRNSYGQTAVMPYAVRALEGAPVATPLSLDELSDSSLGPRSYTLRNVRRRLGQKSDPWQGMSRHAANPGSAARALERLQR